MASTRDVLASLLPIRNVSLEEGEPVRLRCGDEALSLAVLPQAADERLERALRAWATVVREAEADVPASDVLDLGLLRQLHDDAKRVASDEDFLRRWRWRLSRWLPPLPEVEAAAKAVREHFEAAGSTMAQGELDGGVVSLEFVSAETQANAVMLVVRLVVWDRDGEKLSIRDVKEQQVYWLSAGPGIEPARVKAFLVAFAEAASEDLSRRNVEAMMPHDLVIGPQAFKRGETVEELRTALRKKLKL